MKYTVARFAFVATAAAIVGVFVALIIYFTLVAALIFLLVATVAVVALQLNGRKRVQGRLQDGTASTNPPRGGTLGPGTRTNPPRDRDRR
jgi:large-conductance mechanosensitive channel